MYRRPESVLVLVYTEAGDVLLLKRVSPACFWQSVTGSLEAAETPLQAAHRELAEETGINDAELLDCQFSTTFEIRSPWRAKYAPGTTQNKEHVFCCQLAERPAHIVLATDEHSAFVWLPVHQAVEKTASTSNRDALQRFVVNAC